MKGKILLAVLALYSWQLSANVLLAVEGRVVAFNDKAVILSVQSGKISVPRERVQAETLELKQDVIVILDAKTNITKVESR